MRGTRRDEPEKKTDDEISVEDGKFRSLTAPQLGLSPFLSDGLDGPEIELTFDRVVKGAAIAGNLCGREKG